MIHLVPDSKERKRMLRVVVLQRRLVRALCVLHQGASVDLDWLQQKVWPTVDSDWVSRFWKNQNSRRQEWMNTVAAANKVAKDELLKIMEEQHRFRELYNIPAGIRLTQTDAAFWELTDVRQAMRSLLLDFYEPWLGQSLGYPNSVCRGRGHLTRRTYLNEPKLSICPYCDNELQCAELDHFLPKSSFPFLSVHPDNLIPSCHDSNRGDHKGDTPPLDWAEQNQAAEYFHPRWRSGANKFKVVFPEQTNRELATVLEAVDPADQPKVDNLDNLFRLAEFWGRTLSDDIQIIQKEIADELRMVGGHVDISVVQACLLQHLKNHRRWLNKRSREVYWTHLYAFTAQSDLIIREILRQHEEDLNAGF